MFGISAGEFIVLVVVAAVILGPERLPDYARQLARLITEMRRMAQGAGAKVREEMGPEFDEIDWRKLDPRQYDPRRIVREALADTFDPEDPLGLNEFNRSDSTGNGTRSGSRTGEKPKSRGGPTEATAAAQAAATANAASPSTGSSGTGSSGTGSSGTGSSGTTDEAPAPSFDPDAT